MIMHDTISVILNLMEPHKQNWFRTAPSLFFFCHLKIIFRPVKFHVWEKQRLVVIPQAVLAVKPAQPQRGAAGAGLRAALNFGAATPGWLHPAPSHLPLPVL